MSLRQLCLCAALLLVSLSTPARAQGINAHSGEISWGLGTSSQTGVDGSNHPSFGFSGGFNFTKNVAILGELNIQALGTDPVSGNAAINDFLGTNLRFSLPHSNRVVPYLMVGIGEYVVGDGDSTFARGVQENLGGGASIYTSKKWGIRPELRWEHLQDTSNADANYYGYNTSENNLRVSVSVFYQWGGKKSSKE